MHKDVIQRMANVTIVAHLYTSGKLRLDPAPDRLLASLARCCQTSLYHRQQMLVLQRRSHPLFVVELLVDGVLGLVRAGFDPEVDPVPSGEGPHEPYSEREAWDGARRRLGMMCDGRRGE